MFAAQALVFLAHLRDFPQLERDAQRIERRSPQRTIGIAARDHHQAFGFLRAVARALVRDVGGGGCALEEERAFVVIAGPDLQDCLGKPQPEGAVLGRDRNELAKELHPGAEVVAREGRIDLAPEDGRGLRDLTRIRLDLGFELDCGVVEVGALVGLVGGKARCEEQNESSQLRQQRGRAHAWGETSAFRPRGCRAGDAKRKVKTCRGRGQGARLSRSRVPQASRGNLLRSCTTTPRRHSGRARRARAGIPNPRPVIGDSGFAARASLRSLRKLAACSAPERRANARTTAL